MVTFLALPLLFDDMVQMLQNDQSEMQEDLVVTKMYSLLQSNSMKDGSDGVQNNSVVFCFV